MEIMAIYLALWFVCFPKSFGRHLGVVLRAMRDDEK